ncbi:YdcF family protein [Hydrogenimonas sp.]
MKKFLVIVIFVCGVLIYSFLNLGKFLDISESPQKVDIIASLGGYRLKDRIKKAYNLYEKGYSKSKKIIINSDFDIYAFSYLKEKGVKEENIIFMKNASNTMNEIYFIKNYMLKNKMHSVIIVSDPPHLRRIKLMAHLANFKKLHLRCIVIGSEAQWWNRNHYYRHGFALSNAISELVKLVFNYIKYGILMEMGLWEPIEKFFRPYENEIKQIYKNLLHFLWTIYN